jgi:hypothetical protein
LFLISLAVFLVEFAKIAGDGENFQFRNERS